MDLALTLVTIWMLAVWGLGAITITVYVCKALNKAFSKKQAPEPTNIPGDPKEAITQQLRKALVLAMEHGYVITVENKPRTPLAMGNSYMDFDVREASHRYKQGGAA